MSATRSNAPAPPGSADLSGRTVGNWRLVRRLGAGGFGAVYEAQSLTIAGRRAAVKILHPEVALRDDHKRRFINEASAASAAENENIVQVFDGGVTPDGLCFVVMELLQGVSLKDRLREGPLDLARAIHLGRQVANALASAHRAGIVHRDLKPENIFLVPQTFNPEFVKVLDFGIAKLADSSLASPVSTTSGWIGTPHYMSPEQWRQAPDIDGRADIYALGVILFEGITGTAPYTGESSFALMTAHLNHLVPDPGERAAVPKEASRLIMRMLAKERDERPRTMAVVMEELAALDPGASPAVEPLPGGGASPASRRLPPRPTAPATGAQAALRSRHRRVRALAAAGLVMTAVAAAVLAPRLRSGAPAAPPAPAPAPSLPAAETGAPAAAPVAPLPPWPDELVPFGPAVFDAGRRDPDRLDGPAHPVRVGRFALMRYEVGIGEYERFAAVTHAPGPLPWDGIRDLAPVRKLPVNLVTQIEAAGYCAWKYGAWGGRLPTEGEWEFAARDGLSGRHYPWAGEAFHGERVNAARVRGAALVPVDSLPAGATPRGLHHLIGNVAEWTASPASLYPGSRASVPVAGVVVRGGSVATTSVDGLSATARQFSAADRRDPYIGFRCAVSLP